MSDIVIEQARFVRDDTGESWLAGRSPGFQEPWIAAARKLVVGFGVRPTGQSCPGAVFARPLADDQVAVVQVVDRPGSTTALGFHFLVVNKADYQAFLGDPFWLARRYPANWENGAALEAIAHPR